MDQFQGEKWKHLRIFSKFHETSKNYQNVVHGIQKLKLKMARPKVLFQDLAAARLAMAKKYTLFTNPWLNWIEQAKEIALS